MEKIAVIGGGAAGMMASILQQDGEWRLHVL